MTIPHPFAYKIANACNADHRIICPGNWPNYWADTLLVDATGEVTMADVEPEEWLGRGDVGEANAAAGTGLAA